MYVYCVYLLQVIQISVDWFTVIPGLPVSPVPHTSVLRNGIKQLRYFYIHPCRHFLKDGLCEYKLGSSDKYMHREEFNQRLVSVLKPGESDNGYEGFGGAAGNFDVMLFKICIISYLNA